jgi:hypothetical protein
LELVVQVVEEMVDKMALVQLLELQILEVVVEVMGIHQVEIFKAVPEQVEKELLY